MNRFCAAGGVHTHRSTVGSQVNCVPAFGKSFQVRRSQPVFSFSIPELLCFYSKDAESLPISGQSSFAYIPFNLMLSI